MKLACEFVINTVAGDNIAVPVGKNLSFRGYIKVNETAKEIFEMLKKDTDREKIISALRENYPDAKPEEITESVDDVIGKLTAAGLIV